MLVLTKQTVSTTAQDAGSGLNQNPEMFFTCVLDCGACLTFAAAKAEGRIYGYALEVELRCSVILMSI